MRIGLHSACRDHDPGRAHPDSSARLTAIERALDDHPTASWESPFAARRSAIETVHDPAYLDKLEAFCADGGGPWDPDTVASPETWRAALAAAGVSQWVAEGAVSSDPGPRTPFGLCRPPGHHAMYDTAMGFCFFNNVAIAAQTLFDDHGIERVGIIDWDVHHANGTESYAIDREGVALVSLHQRGLYPGTGTLRSESHDRVLNVPLPSDLGDADYLRAVEVAVAPAMRTFEPEVILVSCGFDAHIRDVLASQRLSSGGFGLLADATRQLSRELDAGCGVVLEGGYALDIIGNCARSVVDAFSGNIPDRPDESVDERLDDALAQVGSHPLLAQ